MFFNIAKNNLKKSFKDYTIYFLTLSFAVCVFYAFNSIDSQSAMATISESNKEYLEIISIATGVLSIFVSIILGALIIYANNFLVKRRKKELGIYMTLGMGRGKISRLLVLETLIVGILSLIVGLMAGLVVLQGLSALTTKLFGGIISKLGFVISYSAIIKTCIYFGIIFVLVMIFNTITVSKYKLIDLLTAGQKNEQIKVKNPIMLLIIFLVGTGLLICGYAIVLKHGLTKDGALYKAIAFGFIGTFLFFYGLAGFIVMIIQKNKNRYLKGLNIFTTKQMNNKINTTFVSMSLISLMLFVTISALSTGVSLKNAMSESVKSNTPFDVSVTVYPAREQSLKASEVFKTINEVYPNYSKEFKSEIYNDYSMNIPAIIRSRSGENTQRYTNIMTITDYNKLLDLKGEKQVELDENSVLVIGNADRADEGIDSILEAGAKLIVDNKEYRIQNKKLLDQTLRNSQSATHIITFIVPNSFITEQNEELWRAPTMMLNANVKNKLTATKIQAEFSEKMRAYEDKLMKDSNNADNPIYLTYTRDYLVEASQGMTTIILYIAIYIGIIFLLTSSAVIALQQLVEATDSKERYDTLRKIGATDQMINKAISKQVSMAFVLPLIIAIIDSIIGIKAISRYIEMFGKVGIVNASILTAGIIVIIYGGYMIATYFGFKNAVRK